MIERLFTQSDFFLIFSFLILIAFSVLLSDVLERMYKNTHEEILRKLPHILIGIIFTLTPFLLTQSEIILLSLILVFGILLGKYSPFFKTVFSVKRVTYGMWLTPLSLGLMAFIWLPENITPFVFGILVLTFSDSLAALFGRLYGKKKIPYTSKTYVGSTVFFLTTLFVTSLLAEKTNMPGFLLIASVLTGFEILLIFGFDNLLLPIVASFMFNFLL